MDYFKDNYFTDNIFNSDFILSGKNDKGNLLSLKSTDLYGNIDIYTNDTSLSLKVNNSSISFNDNDTNNDITFDLKEQVIKNTNSNVIKFTSPSSIGASDTKDIFNMNEGMWKSQYVFKYIDGNFVYPNIAFLDSTDYKIFEVEAIFSHC